MRRCTRCAGGTWHRAQCMADMAIFANTLLIGYYSLALYNFAQVKNNTFALDFEHFSPNIDDFAPIQKGHFALYFIIFFGVGTGIKIVIKLKAPLFCLVIFLNWISKKIVPTFFQNLSKFFEARNATFFFFLLYYNIFS